MWLLMRERRSPARVDDEGRGIARFVAHFASDRGVNADVRRAASLMDSLPSMGEEVLAILLEGMRICNTLQC